MIENNNPFFILGIEPTDDLKIIKNAYQEKLKDCHPEENPEGFAVLHNAYTNARKYARQNSGIHSKFQDIYYANEEITFEADSLNNASNNSQPDFNPVYEPEQRKTEPEPISESEPISEPEPISESESISESEPISEPEFYQQEEEVETEIPEYIRQLQNQYDLALDDAILKQLDFKWKMFLRTFLKVTVIAMVVIAVIKIGGML